MTTAASDPASLDQARERRARQEDAWNELRAAIADDLIAKLPERVPVKLLPGLLRIPCIEVSQAISSGAIATVIDEVVCMVTADSRGFLTHAAGIRLPLSQRFAPRARPTLAARPLSS